MFNAQLVSQSDGQSYSDVLVFEEQDLKDNNIPNIFEEWTCCMIADQQLIISHMWKMRVIKIDEHRKVTGSNSILIDKLVLDGNIVYEDVKLLDAEYWLSSNIPYYFRPWGNIAHQMVFTNRDGTFITHDTNVVGLTINDASIFGINLNKSNAMSLFSSQHTKYSSHVHVAKQDNKPGNITYKLRK